jgi:acyl-coenzyme A synthetase/AMP-(fatty) acid ligase
VDDVINVAGHRLSSGDIETPWEEIDNAVKLQLGGMKESLAEAAQPRSLY